MTYSLFGIKTPTAPATHTNLDSYTLFRKQGGWVWVSVLQKFRALHRGRSRETPRSTPSNRANHVLGINWLDFEGDGRAHGFEGRIPRRRNLKLATNSSAQLKKRNGDDKAVSHES